MTSQPIGGPTRLDDLLGAGPNTWDQNSPLAPKPDTILGGIGNDTIFSATLGGSQLEGNEGNDVLVSRGPDDTLFGGPGNDSLVVENVSRAIGGDGRDTLRATATATLYGGADNDLLIAQAANNLLFGNEGDDTILGGAQGGDSIYGGQGNDLIGFVSTGDGGSNLGDRVRIGTQVSGVNQGRNFIAGNKGNDTIIGVGDNDSIYGGEGDDSIVGVGNNNFLSGDKGNDTVIARNPRGTIELGFPPVAVPDVLIPLVQITLQGGEGNDSLVGPLGRFREGNNLLDGGSGDDTITSFAFQDSLSGGDGNDLLMTMNSSEVVSIGFGTATSAIAGFAGESTLDGGAGDDTLIASFEGDVLLGGPGNDSLFGTFSIMDGGDGNDTLDGRSFFRPEPAEGAELSQLTVSLSGGAGNDLIFAVTAPNVINVIAPGPGDDTIVLGSTRDQLLTDSFNLEGNDSISAANVPVPEAETPGGPRPGLVLLDTLGSNTIEGTVGDDFITGGSGNDVLRGGPFFTVTADNVDELPLIGAGNDTLVGGSGNDFLFGGNGNDSLVGGDGDDTLQGGFNSGPQPGLTFGDTLIGGSGNDVFFYQFEAEVYNNGQASTLADLIGDFAPGSDRLAFTRASGGNGGFRFNSTGRPNNFEFIQLLPGQTYQSSLAPGAAPPVGTGIEVARINTGVLVYNRTAGLLQYDPDGSGPQPATDVARFTLVGGNGPDLSQGDITFI